MEGLLSSTWLIGQWRRHECCYCLSKQPNCSRGTCSGPVTWQLRCTTDALSRTRHVVPLSLLCLMTAPMMQIGGVNCTMPALSMTRASALALVPFPQLSLPVCSYRPIIPSPCTLGQQVITSYLILLFCNASCLYCSAIASLYAIVPDFSIVSLSLCSGHLIMLTYACYW